MSVNCMEIGNTPSCSSNYIAQPETESLAPEIAAVALEEPLAYAVDFAEWQSLELQHLSPKLNLENRQSSVSAILEKKKRQSSVSAVAGILRGFMSLSASLLFPAGAGVVTQAGSKSIEVTHVVAI